MIFGLASIPLSVVIIMQARSSVIEIGAAIDSKGQKECASKTSAGNFAALIIHRINFWLWSVKMCSKLEQILIVISCFSHFYQQSHS